MYFETPSGSSRWGVWHAQDDAQRSLRRDARGTWRQERVRHRRLGLHGCARSLPHRRHPLHPDGARAGRRPHGRRLRPCLRAPGRVHRPERPRRDQLRDIDRGRLLGALPGGGRHARDRLRHHGPRRLPGDGPAADLLQDHQVPGPREQRRRAWPRSPGAASTWRWPSAGRPSSTSRAIISTARSTARSRAAARRPRPRRRGEPR